MKGIDPQLTANTEETLTVNLTVDPIILFI